MKLTVFLMLFMLILSACAQPAADTPLAGSGEATPAVMTLTSPNFAPGEAIPAAYTCQGADISPALQWSSPPAGTQSLALIVDDPDAPAGTWVHWVVYNLPPDVTELPEGASQANASGFNLPPGAMQGVTSFKRRDYGGPCPPSGRHRYFFRLYALDTVIAQDGLDKTQLLQAMQGHVLAVGELMGTYQK